LLSYGSLSYVAIVLNGQSGSFVRELFFAFCLIPAFILCVITSKAVDTHKRRLKKARQELERKNEALFELNETLKFEQALTEAEMELAHDIQCALLPSKAPDVSDWDIAFYSRPKSSVSGDFYDFYSSNGTLDGLALFDVSGHGVAPALVTILLKPLLFKNFNKFNDNPVKIFEQSNKEVLEDLEDVNIYITGVLLKIKGAEVEYLNAGHPDILYLKDNGKVEAIIDEDDSFKGRPLGIGDVLDYSSFTFNVNNNEMLLLYTDGLIESRNSGGKQFGSENLTLSFSKCYGMSASDSLNFILEEFYSFLGNSQPIDDITVIIAKKL
jgi:sigma-B regulation protein RsbU (phosphoserine phosphatase)